jgi:hypothetical protein
MVEVPDTFKAEVACYSNRCLTEAATVWLALLNASDTASTSGAAGQKKN